MKKFYAYILRDPRCMTPFYVGKGTGFRVRRHLGMGGHSKAVASKVNKLRKEGCEPHVEVVAAIDEGHAFFLESCLIQTIGRRDLKTGPLMNLTDGGEGMSGWICSDEQRAKLKARHENPSYKAKLLAAHLGAKRSDETRRKQSEKALARGPVSEETRRKLSEAHKRRPPRSEETRRKLSERVKAAHAANPRVHSEETRRKMSETQLARRKAERECRAKKSET